MDMNRILEWIEQNPMGINFMISEIMKVFGVSAEVYKGLIFIKKDKSVLVTNRHGVNLYFVEDVGDSTHIEFDDISYQLVAPTVEVDNSEKNDLTLSSDNGIIELVEKKVKSKKKE